LTCILGELETPPNEERYSNYENALKKAEKERKEINYGNYLLGLSSETVSPSSVL